MKNCQTAKLKSLPNKLSIRYVVCDLGQIPLEQVAFVVKFAWIICSVLAWNNLNFQLVRRVNNYHCTSDKEQTSSE